MSNFHASHVEIEERETILFYFLYKKKTNTKIENTTFILSAVNNK